MYVHSTIQSDRNPKNKVNSKNKVNKERNRLRGSLFLSPLASVSPFSVHISVSVCFILSYCLSLSLSPSFCLHLFLYVRLWRHANWRFSEPKSSDSEHTDVHMCSRSIFKHMVYTKELSLWPRFPVVFSSGNYVLNYLATRPKLAAFVTQALIQLYARITKLGWFDCQKEDYVFRNVIVDVTRFLQV